MNVPCKPIGNTSQQRKKGEGKDAKLPVYALVLSAADLSVALHSVRCRLLVPSLGLLAALSRAPTPLLSLTSRGVHALTACRLPRNPNRQVQLLQTTLDGFAC